MHQVITVTLLLLGLPFISQSCNPVFHSEKADNSEFTREETEEEAPIRVGASHFEEYLPMLKGKRVGMVVNQTSEIDGSHLVDVLIEKGIDIGVIFAPEHGYRGEADAGADIKSGTDQKTGIQVISLYGNKKKPEKKDLADIDIVLFDIQDVGARFYTYISTLKYVMESCAQNDKPLLLLDRPNPNGHYVDGPMLDPSLNSFVGIIPVPVVHGMTVGELALIMNGEKWLDGGISCHLHVVKCTGYTHQTRYILPVKPSPNLPNERSVLLYPSLCLFEGTQVSVGRGTDKQFQVYGSPGATSGAYTFVPVSKPGASSPFHMGKTCRGHDLTKLDIDSIRHEGRINLSYFLEAYSAYPDKEKFFLSNNFIDKLAGTKDFKNQVIQGLGEEAIRKTWLPGLEQFKTLRSKYLLYP